MNDEIKEILRDLEFASGIFDYTITPDRCTFLKDYITNLQQENEYLNNELNNMTDYAKDLQQELEEEKRIEEADLHKIQTLEEENERLKDIVIEKDSQIKEMIMQKTDYTAVNILEMKLEDYKSRCEKAIEYINHAQNYGTMAQVMPHLKPYVNGDDLLNILQNGDNNEVNK